MACLPDTLLHQVFSHLTIPQQAAGSRVSHYWHSSWRHYQGSWSTLDLCRRPRQVTDAVVVMLAEHCGQGLQHVNLSGCTVTDRALEALAEHCPNLRTANLTCLRDITEGAVRALCRATKIESLELSGCSRISEEAIRGVFAPYCDILDEDELLDGFSPD